MTSSMLSDRCRLIVVIVVQLMLLCDATTLPLSCSSSTNVVSNQEYTWTDCTIPSSNNPAWIIFWGAAAGARLENVTIRIVRGNSLPLIDFSSSSSVSSLQNVSIFITDVVVSWPAAAITNRFIFPAFQKDLHVEFRNCSLSFTGKLAATTAPVSFISSTQTVTTLVNVHFGFYFCNIRATLPGSLLSLSFGSGASNNISVHVEDCTMIMTTTGVDVYVFEVFSPRVICSGDRITRSETVAFVFLRSHLSFTQDCTDPSSLCGNSSNPSFDPVVANVSKGVQSSYSAWVHWDVLNYRLSNAVFVIANSTLNAQLLLPAVQTDATRLPHSMSLLRVEANPQCLVELPGLFIMVEGLTSFIASSQGAALIRFDHLRDTTDAVMTVKDSTVTLVAAGALNRNANTRFAAIIYFGNWSLGPNLTVTVLRVTASLQLLSGEAAPSALAASPLVLTLAALVYSTAGAPAPPLGQLSPSTHVSVSIIVRDTVTLIAISNGTLPRYQPPFPPTTPQVVTSLWPNIAMYGMLASLVLLERQNSFSFTSVLVSNCSLTSSIRLSLGSSFVCAVVTPVSALIIVVSNCTSCNFTIVDSVLEVAALSFPKQDPHQQYNTFPSWNGTVSGRLLLNTTSLFQAFDVTTFGHLSIVEALPPLLAVTFLSFPELVMFLAASTAPIVFDAVNILISNSALLFPISTSQSPQTTTASLVTLPLPADVLAIISIPDCLRRSTILVQGTTATPPPSALLKNAKLDIPSGAWFHPVAVFSLLGSNVYDHCVFHVSGLDSSTYPTGAMVVTALNPSRLDLSTTMKFANNVFNKPKLSLSPPLSPTSSTKTSHDAATAVTVFGPNASLLLTPYTADPSIPPSATKRSSAVFFVEQNFFRGGFSCLFDEQMWPSMLYCVQNDTDTNMSLIFLGCNLWNGKPLSASNIFTAAAAAAATSQKDWSATTFAQLRHIVSYPPRSLTDTSTGIEYDCPGLMIRSITTTMAPVLPVLAPVLPPPTSSVAASWFGGAASLGALLFFSPSALLDGQTLAALGGSACAPPALKKSTSLSQFMLSPFYPLGPAAIVLGNGGLALFIVATHALVVLVVLPWISIRRDREKATETDAAAWTAKTSSLPTATPVKPWTERLQFPNHSLTACTMLVQGIVYGVTSELFTPSPLHILCGVVGLGLLVAAWLARRHVEHSARARLLQWRPYPHRVVVAQRWAPRRVLPLGRWEPEAVRMTHGRLRGPVRETREAYALYPLLCSLVVSVVAGLPVPPSWCVVQWSLLTCVPLAGCAVAVVLRPARAPLSDALYAVGYVLQLALFVTMALLASGHGDGASEANAVGLLSILSSLCCMVRLMHTQFMSRWEAQLRCVAPAMNRERICLASQPEALRQLEQLIVLICSSKCSGPCSLGFDV